MSRATQTFSSRITLRIRSPGPMVSRPPLGPQILPEATGRTREVSRVPKAVSKNYTYGIFF